MKITDDQKFWAHCLSHWRMTTTQFYGEAIFWIYHNQSKDLLGFAASRKTLMDNYLFIGPEMRQSFERLISQGNGSWEAEYLGIK